MLIEHYGFKYLMSARTPGTYWPYKTLFTTNKSEALKYLHNCLSCGCTVTLTLYKHGNLLGAKEIFPSEFGDDLQALFESAVKYCEDFKW